MAYGPMIMRFLSYPSVRHALHAIPIYAVSIFAAGLLFGTFDGLARAAAYCFLMLVFGLPVLALFGWIKARRERAASAPAPLALPRMPRN